MSQSDERNMRWWIALIIIAATATSVVWAWATEHWMRFYFYVFFPIFGLIALGWWYAFLTGLPWKARFRALSVQALILFLVIGGFFALFRYDGTFGGSSLVKFAPRWQAVDEEVAALEGPATADVERSLEEAPGLADSLQFLGPDRTGEHPGIQLNPDWESNPPELLWQTEVGAGWGSFAVSGRNAITMEQREDEEVTTCRDVLTGDLIWAHADPGVRFEGAMGGIGPRSTPLIREGKVYTQGASGIVNCLDETSGELIWSTNPMQDLIIANPEWGKSNSPLLSGGLLILSGGANSNAPLLIALDPKTGDLIWQSESGAASYSSPVTMELMGFEQVVYLSQDKVTGHDFGNGGKLWEWNWELNQKKGMPKVAQPRLVGPEQLLLTASYNQGTYLISLESGVAETVWESRRMKTKFSSTVIRDGYAYGLDEGIFSCLDIATGERIWKGGRYGFGQQIMTAEHILVQAEQGDLVLLDINPEDHVEVARVPALVGTTWNVPTLAGAYLLVRNAEQAACYRLALE